MRKGDNKANYFQKNHRNHTQRYRIVYNLLRFIFNPYALFHFINKTYYSHKLKYQSNKPFSHFVNKFFVLFRADFSSSLVWFQCKCSVVIIEANMQHQHRHNANVTHIKHSRINECLLNCNNKQKVENIIIMNKEWVRFICTHTFVYVWNGKYILLIWRKKEPIRAIFLLKIEPAMNNRLYRSYFAAYVKWIWTTKKLICIRVSWW